MIQRALQGWRLATLLTLSVLTGLASLQAANRPNFVVIFCDDLGYGDLGCYGNPSIQTPNLDRMAREGTKFTQFYSASPVCTPSRSALMTGRLPVRTGMCSDRRRVLFPDSGGGLPASEHTLAEALKEQGYATACVGKWHLGHLPQYLPTRQGFDEYFGIPYSNDMDRIAEAKKGRSIFWEPKSEYWNVPLLKGEKEVERPTDQTTITRRYTEAAVDFIQRHREEPFFLYLPHSMPHVPLFASQDFLGKSRRGLFGDVIEEIDWSVGKILDTLRDLKLDKNTLVFFTSDNGPWLIFNDHGGSAGPLRDGKGSTWEGGMREPALAWWPGTVPAGRTTHDLAGTMDLYTTLIHLGGGEIPKDRVVDGLDMTALLKGKGPSPRQEYFYYRGEQLYAARQGAWKAHFITQGAYDGTKPEKHETPVLYNLEQDIGEQWNVADKHPEVIASIRKAVEAHEASLVRGTNQMENRIGKWTSLFDGKSLTGWKRPDFAGGGDTYVEDGRLVIDMGETLSGLTYTNDVPKDNFEIELEAQKVDGSDFFCALTFPVGTNHCTLVLGGWGGAVVGISSIDNMDASDNETTQFFKFPPGQWFKIRVVVGNRRILAWLDDENVVDLDTKDRRIGMRYGDIELNVPLGLATFQTTSAIRSMRLRSW